MVSTILLTVAAGFQPHIQQQGFQKTLPVFSVGKTNKSLFFSLAIH